MLFWNTVLPWWKKKRTNTSTGSHFSLVHCLSKLTSGFWQLRYKGRKFLDKPLFWQQELGGRQTCRPNWSFIIGLGIQIKRYSNMGIKRHHESPRTRIIYLRTILKGDFWLTFTFYHNTLFLLCFFYFSFIHSILQTKKTPTSLRHLAQRERSSAPTLYHLCCTEGEPGAQSLPFTTVKWARKRPKNKASSQASYNQLPGL